MSKIGEGGHATVSLPNAVACLQHFMRGGPHCCLLLFTGRDCTLSAFIVWLAQHALWFSSFSFMLPLFATVFTFFADRSKMSSNSVFCEELLCEGVASSVAMSLLWPQSWHTQMPLTSTTSPGQRRCSSSPCATARSSCPSLTPQGRPQTRFVPAFLCSRQQ